MIAAERAPSHATKEVPHHMIFKAHQYRGKLTQELVSAVVKTAADVLRLISSSVIAAYCKLCNGVNISRKL
jgi:hypothetical protein